MATDLGTITSSRTYGGLPTPNNIWPTIDAIAFYGDTQDGPCLQLTIQNTTRDHVELTRNDVIKLRDTLTHWLESRFAHEMVVPEDLGEEN